MANKANSLPYKVAM